MSISVQTNQAAAQALQNINKINDQISQAQPDARAASASDKAADSASLSPLAQTQSGAVVALTAVTASLNRASTLSDLALSAGHSVADLLSQIKAKAASGSDPSANDDFKTLLQLISGTVAGAGHDGANLLDGKAAGDLRFLASPDGAAFVTLSAQDLSLGGPVITLSAAASLGTPQSAEAALTDAKTSIDNLAAALGQISDQARQVSAHSAFVAKLGAALQPGVADQVQPDLGVEGARLAALQIQQQLSGQSAGLGAAGSQALLALFK